MLRRARGAGRSGERRHARCSSPTARRSCATSAAARSGRDARCARFDRTVTAPRLPARRRPRGGAGGREVRIVGGPHDGRALDVAVAATLNAVNALGCRRPTARLLVTDGSPSTSGRRLAPRPDGARAAAAGCWSSTRRRRRRACSPAGWPTPSAPALRAPRRCVSARAGATACCASCAAAARPCRHRLLPGYPSRIVARRRRRLLADLLRAAHPAGRVRAARTRLPQAHDGRDRAAATGSRRR